MLGNARHGACIEAVAPRTLCQMVGQLRGTIFQRAPCDPAKQPCVTLGWDVSNTTQAHTTSFRHLSECRLGLRRWGDAMIAGAASPFAIFFATHQDRSHTSQPTCTIECGHSGRHTPGTTVAARGRGPAIQTALPALSALVGQPVAAVAGYPLAVAAVAVMVAITLTQCHHHLSWTAWRRHEHEQGV